MTTSWQTPQLVNSSRRRPGTGRATTVFFAGTLITLLSGCEAFLPRREQPDEGRLPETYSLSQTEVARTDRWWTEFGSADLDRLVNEALEENLGLRQFWARIAQADARATQSGSLLYPQFDLIGDAAYRRTSIEIESDQASFRARLRNALGSGLNRALTNTANRALGVTQNGNNGDAGNGGGGGTLGGLSAGSDAEEPPGRITQSTSQFGLSLSASYEVDLWGRIASGYRAARLDTEATRADLEATAITVVSEVVERWVRIQEQRELRAILQKQLETNETFLELVELRFRKALVSALDVFQQRQTVSEVERQIPVVESNEQVLRHELAVLLGKTPMAELELGSYDLAQVPPFPEVGVPADLLIYRPDVRAALADLNAADYRVAAARADRLPAIRLTGGIGYDSGEIRNLLDDWFLSVAASLSQPLFDGFRRQAEVERTLAVVEERLAAYRLTILTAIREVEDALVRERKQHEFVDALRRQIEDARNTLREASQRYQKGLNDYLPVLTALERTQLLTRTLVSAQRELLLFRIDLYRALGGMWPRELTAPAMLSDQSTSTKVNAS